MTHDSPDQHADGSMGSKPSQGVFIGWLAIGLLVLMAVFAAGVIGAGWSMGFK
jgi:hypothetical protein